MNLDNKKSNLLKKRIEHLFEGRSSTLMASMGFALVISFLFKDIVPMNILLWWIGAHLFFAISRFILIYNFKNNKNEIINYKKYEYLDAISTGLSGATWGAMTYLFQPYVDFSTLSLLGIVLIGIIAAASGACAPSKLVSTSVSVSGVSILMITCLIVGTQNYLILGLVCPLFLAMNYKASNLVYNEIVKGIQLYYEKELLLEKVTEKYELEVELKEEREKNMQASKMASLGQMAGGVAHEICNPLSILKINIFRTERELAKLNIENKTITDLADVSKKMIERMATIISGLKTISRESSLDSCNYHSLKKILNEVFVLCNHSFETHDISFATEIENESLEIYCQETEFSQVLLNLFNNSCDAVKSLPERWIKLKVIEEDDVVKIIITDSGSGIPDDIQENMLNPFFTTKPVGKGTGLGLSISQEIIEKHHGKFIYDKENSNTSFIIELPKTPLESGDIAS